MTMSLHRALDSVLSEQNRKKGQDQVKDFGAASSTVSSVLPLPDLREARHANSQTASDLLLYSVQRSDDGLGALAGAQPCHCLEFALGNRRLI